MESKKHNALAELAEQLYAICMHTSRSNGLDEIAKAQRIIDELAKEFEPIDSDSVKPSKDGRKHFADFIKAGDKRRCDIMIKCLEIAEEKV